MSELIKIIAIAVLSLVAILILKQIKPEFALLVGIASSLCITFLILDKLTYSLNIFTTIINKTGVNLGLIKIVLKIIGIGYLTEFASSLCIDSGVGTLSDKIMLGGKIIILAEILPLVSSLLELLLETLL